VVLSILGVDCILSGDYESELGQNLVNLFSLQN
jgi:hypothetical protein